MRRLAALGLRDEAIEFAGRFEPFLDDDLDIFNGILIGPSIGHAAGQFGDFSDEGVVSSLQ